MKVIKELDQVVLCYNLLEHGLCAGDIGTVVLIHRGGGGYEVEIMTLDGKTIAVTTLMADEVRSIGSREVVHVRSMSI